MTHYDVIIIGAGAAGLFCGARIGQGGKRVLVIDHAKKPAEKVRISGGGRCNFTNIHTAPENFISANPHFAKSALARYTPWDFMDLLTRHQITWHEKTLGQLFCDGKSSAIINMLLEELDRGGGELWLETSVQSATGGAAGYTLETSRGALKCDQLVIATGGLSIPKMGATGFAYDVAKQFGHSLIDTRPALVPFVFSGALLDDFASISGTATDVHIETGGAAFDEAMLFTHRGLSGPAVLQASSYWSPGEAVEVDLLPGTDALTEFKAQRDAAPKQTLQTLLETRLPKRLAALLVARENLQDKRLGDVSNATLEHLSEQLSAWRLTPTGTEGYRTAEVTVGGVDTASLSSKTMESKYAQGLYFIGECVDVTGWLGGYNFQWAWASAVAAAEAITS